MHKNGIPLFLHAIIYLTIKQQIFRKLHANSVDLDQTAPYEPVQGLSLASAIGHSLKIVPHVREFAIQLVQFVRDGFQKCTLYGNAQ